MTLKNSLWAKVSEDNKRRLWLWLTAVFIYVLLAPLLFLIMIAAIDEATYIQNYGNNALEMLKQAVIGNCELMLGINAFRLFFGAVYGALAAYSGFYWLDDKIRVDFYAALPEKKNSRFWISFLNGIVIYVITSLVGLILSHGILGAFGYGEYYSCALTMRSFGMCFLFFMGVYIVCILAICLTGNIFASVCATAVIALYEFLIRGTWIGYQDLLNYSYHLDTDYLPSFTPWGSFFRAFIEGEFGETISAASYAKLIILTLIYCVLAYIAYMKRPMEAAGRTLAFKKMSTPLKLLIAVPATVLIGLVAVTIAESVNGKYIAVVVIVLAICAVILCAIIEAVFELDVKAVFNKKLHWIIVGVAAIALFFMLDYDVFGLDRRLPQKENVESVAFVPSNFMNTYLFQNNNMVSMGAERYCSENMYITDVDSVYELVQLSMSTYDEFLRKSESESYESYMRYYRFDDAVVIFRSKSGKNVLKKIPVPIESERAHELENRIFASKEFTDGYFSVKNIDYTDKITDNGWNEFSNNFTTINLKTDEILKLLDCYKADLDDFDYEEICKEGAIGTVHFAIGRERRVFNTYYTSSNYFSIYPCMDRCVAYLGEIGYTIPEFTPDNISEIRVEYYRDTDKLYKDPEAFYGVYDMGDSDVQTAVYMGKDEIAQLLPCISTADFDKKWGRGDLYDQAYSVEAQVDTQLLSSSNSRVMTSTSMGHTTVYCNFIKGQVPDFVKTDLKVE